MYDNFWKSVKISFMDDKFIILVYFLMKYFNSGVNDDVAILVECVRLIKRQLSQDLQLRVEYDLHRGLDPVLTIKDVAEQICGKYGVLLKLSYCYSRYIYLYMSITAVLVDR